MPDKKNANEWLVAFNEMTSKTALAHLDTRVLSLDDTHFSILSTISDAHRQPFGLLHGGVSMLFAESVASYHSAWCCDLAVEAPVGVDINGTHISSAKDGELKITATLLRRAKSFVFHEVEVLHLDTGRVLCKARVTNYLKPL